MDLGWKVLIPLALAWLLAHDYSDLRAFFINCTLKRSPEPSHTQGLADISIASFFRNGHYAGFEVDSARWPRTAAFVSRTLSDPCLASLLPFEDVQRSAEIKQRRQAFE